MSSKLYQARLRHIRHYPVRHEFTYELPVFVFDLADLISGKLDGPFFGRRISPGSSARPGPFLPRLLSLHERDYLYAGPGGLRQKLARALEAGGLNPDLAQGQVQLVTAARFLGYVFNPASFWLINHDLDSAGLAAAVAEVNNTFGEKHIYVLGEDSPSPYPARYTRDKEFFVSPFNDMQGSYNFSIGDARHNLDISVDLIKHDRKFLEARLWAPEPGQPVDSRTLAGFFLHPQRVLTLPRIVRQAASLYLRRRLPVQSKPEPKSPMTIRRNEPKESRLDQLAKRLVLWHLSRLKSGELTMKLPGGEIKTFGGREPGCQASIKVHHDSFFRSVLFRESMGLGEAYVDGLWDSDDLQGVFRFLSGQSKATQRKANPQSPGRANTEATFTWTGAPPGK